MFCVFIIIYIVGFSKGDGISMQNLAGTGFPRSGYGMALNLKPEMEPSFCHPHIEPQPKFDQPGRRISEARCHRYIWKLNLKLEDRRLDELCIEYYNKKKFNADGILTSGVNGGSSTGPGDYPHMGAIGWKASVGTEWVFKCGCSLISEKFVLTAGHCTRASPTDTTITDTVPKIVRLGDKHIFRRGYTVGEIPASERNISRIIVHPQYSPPKKYFDIALMELEREVEFSRILYPACLWSKPLTSELGTQAMVTGWGVVESGSTHISPELLTATVDIFDTKTCNNLLNHTRNRNWSGMQDHQICAGKQEGGIDACQGDSGGPLQVKIPQRSTAEGQMHYVFGVISFGIGCGRRNLPGIYTRVSSFIDWIEDNVWGNQTEGISWGKQN